MFFLVNYERSTGQVKALGRFENSQRREAEEARLTLELQLGRSFIEREIVLLEAENEDALRTTHRRYFENSVTLATSMSQAV